MENSKILIVSRHFALDLLLQNVGNSTLHMLKVLTKNEYNIYTQLYMLQIITSK